MMDKRDYEFGQLDGYEDDSVEFDFLEFDYDRERERARRRRREERRRKRRREVMRNRIILGVCILALLIAAVVICVKIIRGNGAKDSKEQPVAASGDAESISVGPEEQNEPEKAEDLEAAEGTGTEAEELSADASDEAEAEEESEEIQDAPQKDALEYAFFESESTQAMDSEEVESTYCILTSVDNHSVVSARNAYDRISPASMTKVLTLLVACERIDSLDDPVTITIEATDYAYGNDCSAVGFSVGETVPVKDLLYGTILPSGADAAYALACHVAGSHEAFVELMNEKLDQLGIGDSAHFTNCAGIYDDDHYCNAYDIAVIMEAAMENSLCREVLSAHRYTTSQTTEHPEGIDLSNLFLRRIEDRDTMGEVIGAKTGFVNQSRNCAVSFYTCEDGSSYICVTADGANKWRCIYDHVAIYNIYAAGNTEYTKQ